MPLKRPHFLQKNYSCVNAYMWTNTVNPFKLTSFLVNVFHMTVILTSINFNVLTGTMQFF